ncbi:hypothetical protein KEM54_002011 [Ascosphaera aggregata]|nr:hypothetical protein KEM54_002011 [Ascosphaera aggregata]
MTLKAQSSATISAPASISPRQNSTSTATNTTHIPTAVPAAATTAASTLTLARTEEGNSVATANMSSKRQGGHHSSNPHPDLSSGIAYSSPEMTDLQNRTPKTLLRGSSVSGPVLETVQEGVDNSSLSSDMRDSSNNDNDSESKPPTITAPRADKDSGSDSGGNASQHRLDDRRNSKQRTQLTMRKPGDIISKRSFASLPPAKGKSGEVTARNMIVEAETVSSVPQVSLGVGQGDRERNMPGRADSGGVLRMKASDETIRPKKKEKKLSKSTRALPAASGTSKSDFFEYKVKTAVDEADSSDSAETFVYDSNPADATVSLPSQPIVKPRYHSRTPSVTSTTSQADQYIGRPRPAPPHKLSGKRSMKFTNNNGGYGGVLDVDDPPDNIGAAGGFGNATSSSARNNVRNGRCHLHSSRQYRPSIRNNIYPSILEPSPFFSTGNNKQARHNISNARGSTNHLRSANKNRDEAFAYDFDGEGADDERAPLLGSIRTGRYRHGRRHTPASLRQLEYLEQRQRSWFARYAFCAVLLSALFFIVTIGTSVVVGLTKPLYNLSVMGIENVIASEQEIMLDIDVEAVNLNLLPLTVAKVDVNIFAKSKFIGNDGLWSDLAIANNHADVENLAEASEVRKRDTADEGTNPMPDPDDTPADNSSTMLLGRVFNLNAPLNFEPSPWHHYASSSVGQIRLAHPGNKTEEGGTKRWERVLQHQFELILRGVVHYQLPMGNRYTSAPISGRVEVIPGNEKLS